LEINLTGDDNTDQLRRAYDAKKEELEKRMWDEISIVEDKFRKSTAK
jgi:hypothetical protein